jgi:hypothetical protein
MKKQYKPFNLTEALQGNVKVETKAGQEVTELTYLKTRTGPYKVIGIVGGHLLSYTENGIVECGRPATHDLQMYGEIAVCYTNVYKMKDGTLHLGSSNKTKEQALNALCEPKGATYIKTIEITEQTNEDISNDDDIYNELGMNNVEVLLNVVQNMFGGDIKGK